MEGTDAGMRRGLRKAAYAGNRCRLPVTGTAGRRVCGVSQRERALPGGLCGGKEKEEMRIIGRAVEMRVGER